MGFKQHISRTWQMIEQQVNDVPFRPDNEAIGEVKNEKSQYLCGFADFENIKNYATLRQYYANLCKNLCRHN